MPYFSGKAINARGETVRFSREAESRERLLRDLRSSGLVPVKISAVMRDRKAKKRQFPMRAVTDFTETLGLLLSSGLSLKDALAITLTIFRKGPVYDITSELIKSIEKGSSLYQALEGFEMSFPSIYRGLVKIGEKIGSLENIFERLSVYLKEKKQLREKITNALAYPVFILIVAVLGIGLLGLFIIPRIEEIYLQFGVGMPQEMSLRVELLKRVLILLGIAVLSFVLIAILFRLIRRRSESLTERWDRFALKLPLVGRIRMFRENLNFLFAMETLTESGYPVEDALSEAYYAVDNRALQRSIRAIEAKIRRGRLLSQAFLEDSLFPERIGQWLVIGERSGSVEAVFRQLRRYYQEEINKWSSRAMTFLEPLFMILVGIIIVVFIIVFVLPVFTIYRDLL
jgi:type II secretory pathway component PulF